MPFILLGDRQKMNENDKGVFSLTGVSFTKEKPLGSSPTPGTICRFMSWGNVFRAAFDVHG
jgi:hypothetical protein